MSDSRFRSLLVLYVIVTLAAVAAGFVPSGYSQQLADTYSQEPDPLLFRDVWLALAIVGSLLTTIVAGLVGLFLLKSWGRTVSLYSTVFGLGVCLFVGPDITQPWKARSWRPQRFFGAPYWPCVTTRPLPIE
jgi:hypothetical protein